MMVIPLFRVLSCIHVVLRRTIRVEQYKQFHYDLWHTTGSHRQDVSVVLTFFVVSRDYLQ